MIHILLLEGKPKKLTTIIMQCLHTLVLLSPKYVHLCLNCMIIDNRVNDINNVNCIIVHMLCFMTFIIMSIMFMFILKFTIPIFWLTLKPLNHLHCCTFLPLFYHVYLLNLSVHIIHLCSWVLFVSHCTTFFSCDIYENKLFSHCWALLH